MKTWKEVQRQIVEGLQSPVGSATHDVALQRLDRMTAICEYHRGQEESGTEEGVSALFPKQTDVLDADEAIRLELQSSAIESVEEIVGARRARQSVKAVS